MSSEGDAILHVTRANMEEIARHILDIWKCEVHPVAEEQTEDVGLWVGELDKTLRYQGIQQRVDIAIVDGCDTSNGHALLLNDQPTAWISLSSYPSKNTIKVFVTHEIIHALHYGFVREYFFKDSAEKNHVGRQLVTEGVATYVTQELLHLSEAEALWSDYLRLDEREKIMEDYRHHAAESSRKILRDWDQHDAQYFYANNHEDIDAYRSGYFIGRKVIEDVVKSKNLGMLDLLSMPRPALDAEVKSALKAYAPGKERGGMAVSAP